MDHSKGTRNTMIQECMKAEIKELRAALRQQTARAERNKKRAENAKKTEAEAVAA